MPLKAIKWLHNKQDLSRTYGARDIQVEATQEPCQVEGKVPEWLEGSIYKQAGGAFSRKHNQLDGLAHLVVFKISKASVHFSNKYMRTIDFENFYRTGERTWSGTATADKKSYLASLKDFIAQKLTTLEPQYRARYKDFNPNVTAWLLENGNKVGSQTEVGGRICLVDPESLDTISQYSTMDPVHNGIVITTPAHYYREGSSGGYHVGVELAYTITTINPSFSLFYNVYRGDIAPFTCVYTEEICSFKYTKVARANQNLKQRPSYMHTIGVSDNYVILVESSLKYDLVKLLKREFSEGVFSMFPPVDIPLSFKILKREESKLSYVTTLSSGYYGMLWHIANCFERDGNIIIEAGCSENAKSLVNKYYRFVLNIANGTAEELFLIENTAFPVVNPSYLKKEHAYVYAVTNPLSNAGLIKLEADYNDSYTSDIKVCFTAFNEEELMVSEPCFVPNPNAISEDDGVILTMVTDTLSEESYLAILDAVSGDLLAKVYSPVAINKGLHTIFVPTTGLETYLSKL